MDQVPGINACVFFRRDVIANNPAPVVKTEPQKPIRSLLQLCLDHINKNGRILFGDIICKKQKTNLPVQLRFPKKKRKRNPNYLTRIVNPKRMRNLKRQRELKALQAQLPLAVENLSDALPSAEIKGAESKADHETNGTDEKLADNSSENVRSRPRRKVTIPFYVPDNISTPSPELHQEEKKLSIKIKGPTKTNAGPVKPISNKTRFEKISPQKTLLTRNSSERNIVRPNCGKPASVEVPLNLEEKAQRKRQRVNYSEDLLDEALFYEEMLLNTNRKKQIPGTKKEFLPTIKKERISNDGTSTEITLNQKHVTKLKPQTTHIQQESLPKFSNEITILPINKTDVRKQNPQKTKISSTLDSLTKTLSTNPEKVFKFNSAVSIQLKSSQRASPAPSPGLTIQSVQSLFDDKSNGRDTIKCNYCRKPFESDNLLARHQTIHLKIVTHKIGQTQILHPKYRKVSR